MENFKAASKCLKYFTGRSEAKCTREESQFGTHNAAGRKQQESHAKWLKSASKLVLTWTVWMAYRETSSKLSKAYPAKTISNEFGFKTYFIAG